MSRTTPEACNSSLHFAIFSPLRIVRTVSFMDKEENKPSSAAKQPAGLEGVVAAQSSVGDVDGIRGVLIYQGLDIHDLAEHSTFEETVFLLWHGRLPVREELDALRRALAASQRLPGEVLALMREFPRNSEPMDALRTAVSALAFYDPQSRDLPPEGAAGAVREALGRKKEIMGFGHRVYRTEDPRSVSLRQVSKEMGQAHGETRWFDIVERLRELMMREKKRYPNVDEYSGSAYSPV